MRCPRSISAAQDVVQLAFYRSFERLGFVVASNPRRTIGIALLAVLACTCGIARGKWESRLEVSNAAVRGRAHSTPLN